MSDPWFKFYPSDWMADEALAVCSPAARGVWIAALCIMHKAEPRGHLTLNGRKPSLRQLGALLRVSAAEAEELLDELVEAGVASRNKGGIIYSRRMVKDTQRAERSRANGRRGGNPALTDREIGERSGRDTPRDHREIGECAASVPPNSTLWNGGRNSSRDNPADKPGVKTQKPEARSQKPEEDDDDARGARTKSREGPGVGPEPPALAPSPRERLLEAMGFDGAGLTATGRMMGGLGDMAEARRWSEQLGLDVDAQVAVVAEVMARKVDGPPSSFRYFTGAMQAEAGRRARAPLAPTVHAERAAPRGGPLPPPSYTDEQLAEIMRDPYDG